MKHKSLLQRQMPRSNYYSGTLLTLISLRIQPIIIPAASLPKRCKVYLTTLKRLKSGYQACQYAKKKFTKAQGEKVKAHMVSIGMYPQGKLDTHMLNRQSDELRWLICNYIVACEQGVTFSGQETTSLCK